MNVSFTTAGAVPAPPFAWVVQLIGKPYRALATLAWNLLKEKHAAILADREPLLVETKFRPPDIANFHD